MDVGLDKSRQELVGDGRCQVPYKWMYKASEELQFGTRSPQTDVYSFASTVYSVSRPELSEKSSSLMAHVGQIYTGQPMFAQNSSGRWALHLRSLVEQGHIIVFAVKPNGMEDGVWRIVRDCWARDPHRRPSMAMVVERLSI